MENDYCSLSATILLGPFCSVLRTAFFPVLYPHGIKCTPYNMIPHPGKVFHPPSPNENYGVFLEIVPFAGNVGGYFHPVGQPHTCNFSQGRIWFFRGRCVYPDTYSPLLGRRLECRGLGFSLDSAPAFSIKLIDGWHCNSFQKVYW